MTIYGCIEKYGWQSEVSGHLKKYQLVDIDFVNSNGKDDETQFLIMGAGEKRGAGELTELFAQFCKENGFKDNTVTSITIVAAADTCKELLF